MLLTREETLAYLRRIGISGMEAPSLPFLFELHRAHVSHLPWQTLDIYAGRPATMDVKESVGLILSNRSGYCFQLNGAFGTLLRTLGYRVAWHRAGVQPLGKEPRVDSFHLGMTVELEGQDGGTERWIVDGGLGDMPYEPLPLKAGSCVQGPFTYRVEDSAAVMGGWRMVHDPQVSYTGVDVAPEAVTDLSVFHENHAFYSRSPQSPWADVFLLRLRNEDGMNELRGCVWRSWSRDGAATVELESKRNWLEALGTVFREPLVRYGSADRDALWNRVRSSHERWKREVR
ncbi:arylamine N-acetyltransferase family protein [Gorillibacterium sp. sgz5001074]|uniref:arylamine N-acetyltransferase family protein n=1 Tax=Gorillibacterium sp. sgz5001074 TaxID=3446695 RepID=UPI003F6790A8